MEDEEVEWELCIDDGFVYKRKKRRLHPHLSLSSTTDADLEKLRRERKKQTLLKLKAKYESEIHHWDSLSNTLRSMQNIPLPHLQQQQTPSSLASPSPSPSPITKGTDSVGGSLFDDLLLQVEAQEAVIHDISNLCDVAEAMCYKQEEQFKQSLFDLPIWASPLELMQVLCDD